MCLKSVIHNRSTPRNSILYKPLRSPTLSLSLSEFFIKPHPQDPSPTYQFPPQFWPGNPNGVMDIGTSNLPLYVTALLTGFHNDDRFCVEWPEMIRLNVRFPERID
ncbi:hypothetical protein AVEN_104779-1 [Araneus ventricosus]|uniref:Uncharacterized protein n=1 Tax=Araneus ventricosus TaxID=182803 RepID=A0A4Y2V5W4_ARAVE|nr:hypothetical protein AVEN_104779-1 [Araneus ventricosus]